MRVRAQVAMVMNLDKCIGCHTCSVTCKQVWTNRPGAEYMWFNDVETKPGVGYPKRWEDQEQWKGGWELDRKGRLRLKAGGPAQKLASIFYNPDLPALDTEYLLGDSMRGVRFLLEYAKAEEHLRAWGVRSTIVVFGSARVRQGRNGDDMHRPVANGRRTRWYDEARRFADELKRDLKPLIADLKLIADEAATAFARIILQRKKSG